MLKPILLLVFVLNGILVYSQNKISGKYCTGISFSGVCYEFHSDSTFEFRGSSCLWSAAGGGVFKIVKDSLFLKFIDLEPRPYTLKESVSIGVDSIDIVVNLFVDSVTQFAGQIVLFSYVKNPSKTETLFSKKTDSKGQLRLRLPISDNKIWITFKYTLLNPIYIEVDMMKNSYISAHINSSATQIITEGETRYLVVFSSKRKLILQQTLPYNLPSSTEFIKRN